MHFENIPEKLKKYDQWIAWKAKPKGEKVDKLPVAPGSGKVADATDPQIHASFKEACEAVEKFQLSGLGFVFTEEDDFSGVDLDDSLRDGQLLDEPARIVKLLNSYTEISPSGQGVKLFLEGRLPGPNKNTPKVELYSHSRFFCVTGNIFNGDQPLVQPRQRELELIYWQYFPEEHARFGEFFRQCHLMRFLLEKSRSRVNLSHSVRIALASIAIAAGDLDFDMPFITLMLSACPDFDLEFTRKQLESLKGSPPYGCAKLKEIVEQHFSDFRLETCSCNLPVKDGRKPSPIRFIPTFTFVEEEEAEEKELPELLPRFPLNVYPQEYQDLVLEVADSFNSPIEIPAVTLLSIVSSCIGRTRGIRVTRNWFQFANLWLLLVGKSGIGKTPAISYIQQPLIVLEQQWFDQYQADLQRYKLEMVEYKKLLKSDTSAPGPEPEKPKCRQIIIDDCTSEAANQIFDDNRRGLSWIRDEFSGVLLDLDKYAGQPGSTKSRLVSAYDSKSWRVNRVEKRFFVPEACLSMFGGIQPKNVKAVFTEHDADTGFIPRFCFVLVTRDRRKRSRNKEVSKRAEIDLHNLIHKLTDLDFDEEGKPVFLEMGSDAKELYYDWHDEKDEQPWRSIEAEEFEPVCSKLQGQCLRIALNLQLMADPKSRTVDHGTMTRAIRLIEYFEKHQRLIWNHMTKQKEIMQLPLLAQEVVKAIIALEDRIEKGRLATRLIAEFLNPIAGRSELESMTKSIGHMAKHLGLETKKLQTGKERGYEITPQALERLKDLHGSLDVLDISDILSRRPAENSTDFEKGSLEKNVQNVKNVQSSDEGSKSSLDVLDVLDILFGVPVKKLEDHIQENEIKRIYLDTETTGLDPHSDQLALIQVLAGDQIFFLDPDQDMSRILADPKILKVGHNLKFDLSFLGTGCRNIFDTYLAERLLTAGITPLRELNLQSLAKKYLNIDLDKSLRTSFKPGQELSLEQVEYAAMDVKVLMGIFNQQKVKLQEESLVQAARLEFEIVPAVAGIELHGCLIDSKKLELLRTELTSKIAYLEEQLRQHADCNFRSPVQVKEALHELGFKVDSTDVKTLKKIDHPFAKTLLQHRKASKLLSSFIKPLPGHVNPKTRRIHPNFAQCGTDTGRFTCSKPNLQQIPKEQEWRDLFIAAPAHRLITADYSQIELRIIAEFSQDPVFLEAYREGKDLHQITADQIGISRGVAKAINFGLCYGMASKGLAEKLAISVKEASEFITRYFRAYPEVKRTLDQLGLKGVASGYSQTPLGRKRYFKPADSYGAQKALERKCRNSPIQSTCGDILKAAIRNLMSVSDIKIVNLIHDEIVMEVPEEKAGQELVEKIREAMVRAGQEFLLNVPIVVDIVTDSKWRK